MTLSSILGTYYLPLLYQAVKEDSATKSGLDILPFMIGIVGAAAVSGGIISFTGHYWGWLFGGPFLSAIGAGLLYTVGSSYPAALYDTAIRIDPNTRCQHLGCQAHWLSNPLRCRHRLCHAGMFAYLAFHP